MNTDKTRKRSVPVLLGGGFPSRDKLRPRALPVDCLARFLNVNPDSYEQVKAYCQTYKIILRGNSAWEVFIREHEQIKTLLRKIQERALTSVDLQTIVNKLPIRRWVLLSGREVHTADENIAGKEPGEFDQYLADVNRENGTLWYKTAVSIPVDMFGFLYEELDKLIGNKDRLRNCAYCGVYFVPKKRTPWQKFCNINCEDNYKKKKKYSQKRALKNSPRNTPSSR